MRSTELVYVADPDPTFRGNLATVLRASGIEVVEFASGAALEAGALAGGPDLVVTASGSPAMEGRQVLARVKCRMSGRRYPLVLVTDRKQSLELVANSVRSLLADWNRLSLHNLASVVTWLQTRGRSGRFEVEAFGVPGTIVLREGEIAQARWKELRGRDVLVYFAQEFPDAGFRFSESLAGELALPSSSGSSRWEIAAPARDLAGRPREIAPPAAPTVLLAGSTPPAPPPASQAHLEVAAGLLERRQLADAFVHLRLAEQLSAPRETVKVLLGIAHLQSGDLSLALQELHSGLRMRLGDAAAVELGAALRGLERLSPPTPSTSTPDPGSMPGSHAAQASRTAPQPSAGGDAGVRPDTESGAQRHATAGQDAVSPPRSRKAAVPPLVFRPETPTLTRALRHRSLALSESAAGGSAPPSTAHPRQAAPRRSGDAVGEGAASQRRSSGGNDEMEQIAPEPVPERPAAARPSLPLRLAGTAECTARTGRSLSYLAAASVAGLVVLATLAVWATGSPLIGAGAWWTDTGAEPAEHEVIGLVRVEQRGGSGERPLRPPLAGARPLAAAEHRSEPLPIDPQGGEPSRTALERAPAPRQLLDPRGARALIDHASGELQLLRNWADPRGDRRAALFDVHVGANGRVRDVHVRQSSGSDDFDRRATEAVYGTVYHPARRGDVEVARWLRQRVASRAE